MLRRQFLGVIGGAAAAWPLVARAQQPAIRVIGFLGFLSPASTGPQLVGFRQGLGDTGHVEGRDLAIEFRWAAGNYGKVQEHAADLVRRKVSIIVATANAGALAAKKATSAIPIVFVIGGDPERLGLVASINQPRGNLSGVVQFSDLLIQKRFELAHELVPTASTIAVLINPDNPDIAARLKDIQAAANAIGLGIRQIKANNEREIDIAFAEIVEQRLGVVLVQNDPFFNVRRNQIIALAAHRRVPAVFEQRGFAEAGGLIAYGTSLPEIYRQAGNYVGRILKGTKVGDLPVVRPTRFELIVNLTTAKALGLTVPPTLIARADEVIE